MLELDRLRCEYQEDPLGIGEVKPRLGWVIASDEPDARQGHYQIQVALDPELRSIVWDSGEVRSANSVDAEYGGPPLTPRTTYYWRVRITDTRGSPSGWSRVARFETALGTTAWRARFVSPEGEQDGASSRGMLLRKEFRLGGGVVWARLYASALGLYELRLNGEAVGDEVLAPGWTAYDKRLLYQTYDVTGLLRRGENALAATVGAGWYKGDLMGGPGRRNVYGSRTALIAELLVRYADGREEIVATDGSWKAAEGPILSSEIYHGESYDARRELPGWDLPGFDSSSWHQAREIDFDMSRVRPRDGVPVRRHERFEPRSLFVTPAGERVLDFGQNLAGRLQIRVSGKAGDRVVLRHAEVLDAKGSFYTANLRAARARIEYTLKGGGPELYEPHFTYMGFRYVAVDEWPGEPDPGSFTAVAIYSEMEQTGSFECSHPLLNKLHANILWGLKSNFVDVPTDCPQRDERLGWTGDAQVFIGTATFLMGADAFYRKWLRDLSAEQLETGGVPFVVPDVILPMPGPDGRPLPADSSTGWGDAATVCPWNLYLRYGDRKLLEEQYPSMKAWVELIRGRARGGVLWDSGFHFGDWVALDAKEGSYFGATPNDFTATAFYAHSTLLLSKAAAVLGEDEDAAKYAALRERIVAAFRGEFFTVAGRIAVRTQTACVLSLVFDLAPPEHRNRVRDTLLELIKENGGHLVTGFLGTPYICRALAESGALEASYDLLLREDYPSWLYQVKMGATTVWEHWDGIKPDGSMWSAAMNSFNHYAYGSVGEWLHSGVAGLGVAESGPGYRRILFRPLPGGGLTYARASLMTVYGRASIDWRIKGGELRVEVVVPHNASATVIVPGAAPAEVGSGSRSFSCPWPPPVTGAQ